MKTQIVTVSGQCQETVSPETSLFSRWGNQIKGFLDSTFTIQDGEARVFLVCSLIELERGGLLSGEDIVNLGEWNWKKEERFKR